MLLLLTAAIFIQPVTCRDFVLKDIRYQYNEKYISNMTLKILNSTLFLDLYVNKILTYGFKANLEFKLRLQNSDKYQSLFSHNIDVCAMVISLRESILKKWFQSLLKYGNFMDNCPVGIGHYYLHGWYMDPSLIPAYLYPGDYRLSGHGYYGKYKTKKEQRVVHCELDVTLG